MMAPVITLKKALLFSLLIHFLVLGFSLIRQPEKRLNYWSVTPVSLVSLPAKGGDNAGAVKIAPPAPKPAVVKKKAAADKGIKIAGKKEKKKKKALPPAKVAPAEPAEPEPVNITAPAEDTRQVPKAAVPAGTAVGKNPGPQSTALVPDVTDFPYTYYLNIIQKKVNGNWKFEYKGAVNEKVIVNFKIYKSGQVQEVTVEKSSGISFLDQSALRAVLLSSPFPPLPAQYDGSFLGVHFGFEFKQAE